MEVSTTEQCPCANFGALKRGSGLTGIQSGYETDIAVVGLAPQQGLDEVLRRIRRTACNELR
jgi:hypothetical protein